MQNSKPDDMTPRIDMIIQALPDFVNVKDGQSRWIEANSVALEVFRFPKDVAYKGKKDSELAEFSPFYAKALCFCEESDEYVWSVGNTVRSAETIPQPDGSVRVFDTIKVPIFNDDGSRKLLIVTGRDVTEHVMAHEELEYSRQYYKSLFQNSPNAVFSLDPNGKFTSVNPKVEELFGYQAEELIGQSISILVPKEREQNALKLFNAAQKGSCCPTTEIVLYTKNQETVEVQIQMMPIIVNGETIGVFGVANNISEQKQNERIIHHMAFHDALTGLANRALLSKTIGDAVCNQREEKSTLAVLFIDLDNFKSWNDTKGHSVGDELLKEAANRLRACVRSNEDMICRLGGDEFIILLPDVTDFSNASQVAKRILDIFGEPWNIAEECVFISASIGIAMATNDKPDAESLIRNADIAMYEAKNKGKNTFRFFDQKLNDKVHHRFKIEKSLRFALDHDEFTLYFQPQVDSMTYQLTGAESLIRWNRPGYGIVSPSEFISIAEECGLIVPIGNWVLREACKQIREWNKQSLPPFRISINISPRQFQDEQFVKHFQETLDETGINGEWLCVEITESVIVPDVDYAQKTLNDLRKMGITIDIDDFGTGYSSFGYLMDFPVDRIKIDKSFIRDISKTKPAAIVKSIIALARNLGIASIAEGVETQSQSEVLAFYGCSELQGYFIHEPVPATEFFQYLAGNLTGKSPVQKAFLPGECRD